MASEKRRPAARGRVLLSWQDALLDKLDEDVEVHLPGGQLMVSWSGESASVWLSGNAELTYEGTLEYMSTQRKPEFMEDELTEDAVHDYLETNPDFFEQHMVTCSAPCASRMFLVSPFRWWSARCPFCVRKDLKLERKAEGTHRRRTRKRCA